MLEVGMERPTRTDALPGKPEWNELGERIEQAKSLLDSDPLKALAQLGAIEHDADAVTIELMKYAVTEARQRGYKWQEIAAASGVADRQAAWRRWTDKGVPKTRKQTGP